MTRKKPSIIRELLRFLNSVMLQDPAKSIILSFIRLMTNTANPYIFIDDSNYRYAHIAFSTHPDIFYSLLCQENYVLYQWSQDILKEYIDKEEKLNASKYLELLIMLVAGLIYDILYDQPVREFREFLDNAKLSDDILKDIEESD